jgi:hypothetical protein
LCLKNLAPSHFFCPTFLSIPAHPAARLLPTFLSVAAHLLPFSDRALLPRLPSFLSFFLRQALAMAEEERREEEEEEEEGRRKKDKKKKKKRRVRC